MYAATTWPIRDPALLEKIEQLQNIMIASVTGGERDELGYKKLRHELFQVPGLKDACPRFVRTCGDLTQLWDHIKTKEDLPSYAKRRTFIRDAFAPLLADIDDDATAREAFFMKGADHDAYTHIRSPLQLAKTSLFIIDPYMDGSIYLMLGTVAAAPIAVQIMTSKAPTDFGLEGQKFVKQHPGFTLEIRKTKEFHDRFVIVDDRKCYLLGASIKDAGNKGFTIVPMEDFSIVSLIKNYANQVWATASPV
jgi:hypothetical protein